MTTAMDIRLRLDDDGVLVASIKGAVRNGKTYAAPPGAAEGDRLLMRLDTEDPALEAAFVEWLGLPSPGEHARLVADLAALRGQLAAIRGRAEGVFCALDRLWRTEDAGTPDAQRPDLDDTGEVR